MHSDEATRRHLAPVVLVAAGGAIGTCGRYLLSAAIPDLGGVPFGILVINLIGAFLLGWLVEALARCGLDIARRRDLRAFLGTGVLGGFTTYSALAADTAILLRDGAAALALAYGIGTVVLGAGATVAGIVTGRHLPGARGARP